MKRSSNPFLFLFFVRARSSASLAKSVIHTGVSGSVRVSVHSRVPCSRVPCLTLGLWLCPEKPTHCISPHACWPSFTENNTRLSPLPSPTLALNLDSQEALCWEPIQCCRSNSDLMSVAASHDFFTHQRCFHVLL